MCDRPEYDPKSEVEFLHPGRRADLIYDGKKIGYLGEVHPDVADNYGLGEKTYIAVLDIPTLVAEANFDIKYTGIANFPAVSRDISLVVPNTVLAGDIEKVIENCGGKLLENFKLFDIYEGDQIEKGFKSMAYSITFRAKDRTLVDDDIKGIMDKLLGQLKDMGIELRA